MSVKFPCLINLPLLRFSALLAALILLLTIVPDATLAGRFERSLIDSGQLWRLLSAHLLHTNLNHALLNVAGLALLPLLFERPVHLWQWTVTLLACCLGTGLGLYLLTSISWYVGLSGALHGLFIVGALISAPALKSRETLIGLLVVAKIIWESLFGAETSTEQLIAASVVTEAHAFGGLTGLLIGGSYCWLRNLNAPAVRSD